MKAGSIPFRSEASIFNSGSDWQRPSQVEMTFLNLDIVSPSLSI